MRQSTVPDTTMIRAYYDDFIDVVHAMLVVVPLDEDWYVTEYPGIARFVAVTVDATAINHFRKHGYFEGRLPFAPGSRQAELPPPFSELRHRLRISPVRGRLIAEIERDVFIGFVRQMLRCVPVDEAWYSMFYPVADEDIKFGRCQSASEHYRNIGYFQGHLPADVDVDEEWYRSRYAHVRTSLERGSSVSPKDHFMRIGYSEGCQPTPP